VAAIEKRAAEVFRCLDVQGNNQIEYTEFVAACINDSAVMQQDVLIKAAYDTFNPMGLQSIGWEEVPASLRGK